MSYVLDLRNLKGKNIYSLGESFEGVSPKGTNLGFTNYYMEVNKKPFLGISGEFHFSRMDDSMWVDEIIKMKMGGINVISTYIFWIHHEEEEGIFDFQGRKNLRKFVELCDKHGLYVIVRIGPFDHGEVRNGGLPDWLYGKPFEVRKLNEGFIKYTRRLYEQIAAQLNGLYYKDGGPVIAAQIDNEYMHSSAPWELTTGISNEWVFGGDDGEAYMQALLDEATKCGIITPFYTCTAWGGAIAPDNMMPLWGGYAYRPWLFYDGRGEHPCTEEYVYQDYHNNDAIITSDFKPAYQPETRPYACCEMGGGMMNTYYYRFTLPYKSVDAMANIKLGSGCNFLGYYVFQGGTNPKGKHGMYLNEGQVPKMSYDYQAALGEFGQVRESYQRLKTLHLFCKTFGEELCMMQTVLPKGGSEIQPADLDTLRYAVRTDGQKGFVFINNFQDHITCTDIENESIVLKVEDEDILFDGISLKAEENCILPFNMDLDGILLVKATAQPITYTEADGSRTYVFLKPEGMKVNFYFKDSTYSCDENRNSELFTVSQGEKEIQILCITRKLANQMYVLSDGTLLFADGAVMEDENGVRLETTDACAKVITYPENRYKVQANPETKEIIPVVEKTAETRYTIQIPKRFMDGLKDARLKICYQGDIAGAYIDGDMITDNFCNGEVWEIGLRLFEKRLKTEPLTIVITPLKEGAKVNVESAMAARMENVSKVTASLDEVSICSVYELVLDME